MLTSTPRGGNFKAGPPIGVVAEIGERPAHGAVANATRADSGESSGAFLPSFLHRVASPQEMT